MAGSEIIVALEKLAEKIKKCQSRQKDLKKLAGDHEADSLTLARQLRTLERHSAALLVQIRDLVAGQRDLEQRQEQDRVTTAEIRESLDVQASRFEADARQFGEMGARAQRLELLGQQVSRKAETLEHRIDAVEQALDRYEERLQACVSLPAQTLESVIRLGQTEEQAESGSSSGSNVVVFKKLYSGEPGAPGTQTGPDREVLQKLKARLDRVEGLAAGLEVEVEESAQGLQALKAGQDRLDARDDELGRIVEQEIAAVSSLIEATRADLERQAADDRKRDAAEVELRGTAEEAAKQVGLLKGRIDTLEAANAEWSRVTGNQQRDLQDLQLQTQVATEHGRILTGKIETLDAGWQGLAETTEWQASQLSELGRETGRMANEADALSGRTEALSARVDETGDQTQVLEQRLREVEDDAARLADEYQRLQGTSRRLADAHRRLSGGVVVLLLLTGVVAALWAYRTQPDVGEPWQGEIASLRQTVDRYAEGLSAQEQRLQDLRGRIAEQPDAAVRLGELMTLIQSQTTGLADQRTLLTDYWRELAGIQGSLQQTGAEVDRLAREQQQLSAEVMGLRQQIADRQPPIRGETSTPPGQGQRAEGLPSSEWVGQQRPGHFTIQVVAVRAPGAVAQVVRSLPATSTLAHYRRLHDGKAWHVLLYGSYPTLSQAREAMAGLPQEIQSSGPWIRSFKSVQADLAQP